MNETMSPSLFETAHGAGTFAYRFSSQQYARSAMAIQASRTGNGKGLAGIDGAAQAGMIQLLARQLGGLHEAIIIARFAPRDLHCSCGSPCCSGRMPNLQWREATRRIGELAIAATPGCISNARLRTGIVMRYYGEKIDLTDLAQHCGVHPNTASKHAGLVLRWLRGLPAKGSRPAEWGEEHRALAAFDEALNAAGLLRSA